MSLLLAAGSGGPPLGIAAITEGQDVVAGVGTDSVFGVAGITEGADTAAGVGTDEVFGVAGIAEGVDTAAGVGTDSVSGIAGISEGADTAAAVGTNSVAGIAGITEGVDTAAGVGTDSVSGIAGITEGADVAAGIGTDSVAGAAGIVEGTDVVAGVGNTSGGGGPNPSLIVKWTPFQLACRYRALRSGTLNVGNTQQNIANLLALAITEANSNSVWARWRTAVNSAHVPSNLMINVPLVPGFIPLGGFFGRMWDWIVRYLRGVA